MTSPEQDRIAAAFETEFARAPMPAGLRARAVGGAVRSERNFNQNRQHWALALVATVVALMLVAALVVGSRALHPIGSIPATVPSASPSSEPTSRSSPSPTSPMAMSAPAFPDGEVGVSYGPVTLSASGGTPPYHWTILAGALPSGLIIAVNGVVSGVPAVAGGASFTVQAADSTNSSVGSPVSMTIAPALTAGYVQACAGGTCLVEFHCLGGFGPPMQPSFPDCGVFGYVRGGVPPYSYNLTSGRLPTGPSLKGWVLEGQFIETGNFRFEVTFSDALGGKATLTPTFNVVPGVRLASGVCTGDYNTGCSVRLPITGGFGTITAGASVWQCSRGCGLPPGFSAVVQGRDVIVTFPKGMVTGWKGTLYVQVADAYETTAMSPAQVSVDITPQPGH